MSRAVKETQTVETGAPRTSKGQSFSASVVKDLLRASDGVGNLIKQTYPSGQTFERRYDGVDRLDTLTQGYGAGASGVVAKLNHAGLGGRRMSRDYWSGGAAVMNQALEYDGDRRVISLEARVVSGSARIRGFGYAWDRANNRRWERRLSGTYQDEGTGVGEAYRYDSAYRLVHDDKDVGDTALDAISTNLTSVPAAPFATANASDYVLDAASNRRQTTILGTTQTYALDASMQTRDLAANQYTFVGNTARSHDLMGNLVGQSDTGRQAFYDADNRLVQWTEGSKDIRYRYDVDGRRTVKEDVGTASFPRTVYFWDGWQTVEEYTNTGSWAVNKQFVWGEGIDECLKANLPDAADIDADSNTTEKVDLYYHHNSLGSVVAVTNAAGAVKESYRYSAFGKPTIYNASNVEIAASAVKQPFMFTGARYDFEEGSGLYQMRHRYYDPVVGRFVSRDPLGLWGDPSQNGNGQAYCGHNPVNRTDRLGLGDEAARNAGRNIGPDTPDGDLHRAGEERARTGDRAARNAVDDVENRQRVVNEEEGKLKELEKQHRENAARRAKTGEYPGKPPADAELVREALERKSLERSLERARASEREAWEALRRLLRPDQSSNRTGLAPGVTTEGGVLVPSPLPTPAWESESWSFDPVTQQWIVTTTKVVNGVAVVTVTVGVVVAGQKAGVWVWIAGVLIRVGGGGGGGRSVCESGGGLLP